MATIACCSCKMYNEKKEKGFPLRGSWRRRRLMRWHMNNIRNPKLTKNSQRLRSGMTKEERHLWYDFLKQQPQTFHRQKIIGNYIVDFYCASASLVIELDGSQHFENEGKEADKARDKYLNGLGIRVLRYSNRDINQNFKSVCEDVRMNLNSSSALQKKP